VLEKLEAAYAGRFQLAKLNSDEVPDIAGQLSQAFGVRSIPFCVLFKDGQPVDGFVGAIPEADIRQFLDAHVAPPVDEVVTSDAQDTDDKSADSSDQPEERLVQLRTALTQTPDNDVLRCELLEALLQAGEMQQAQQLYADVAHKGVLLGVRLRACAHWLAALQAQHPPVDQLRAVIAQNPRDFDARFGLAQTHFAAQSHTEAMDELLEILMREKTWHEDQARETYVAILELMSPALSPNKPSVASKSQTPAAKGALEIIGKNLEVTTSVDPVIERYRRRLSMVIF
jgi:putative thioredoxin